MGRMRERGVAIYPGLVVIVPLGSGLASAAAAVGRATLTASIRHGLGLGEVQIRREIPRVRSRKPGDVQRIEEATKEIPSGSMDRETAQNPSGSKGGIGYLWLRSAVAPAARSRKNREGRASCLLGCG